MRIGDINFAKPSPSYMLNGDDDYLVKKSRNAITELAQGLMSDFNVNRFELLGADYVASVNNLINQLNTPPIMAAYRVIIFEAGLGKLSAEQQNVLAQALKKYFVSPNPFSILLMINRGEYFKGLYKYAEVIDCDRYSASELMPIVNAMVAEKGFTIEPSALAKLIDRSDKYLSNIVGELDKVLLYTDNKNITSAVIDECLPNKNEYVIYEITNALSDGDNYSALKAINAIMMTNSNYGSGATAILSLIINHYRRMLYAKLSALSDNELSIKLGCKPFAVSMARRTGASYKPLELKSIVEKLQNIEFSFKSGKLTDKEIIPLAFSYIAR